MFNFVDGRTTVFSPHRAVEEASTHKSQECKDHAGAGFVTRDLDDKINGFSRLVTRTVRHVW